MKNKIAKKKNSKEGIFFPLWKHRENVLTYGLHPARQLPMSVYWVIRDVSPGQCLFPRLLLPVSSYGFTQPALQSCTCHKEQHKIDASRAKDRGQQAVTCSPLAKSEMPVAPTESVPLQPTAAETMPWPVPQPASHSRPAFPQLPVVWKHLFQPDAVAQDQAGQPAGDHPGPGPSPPRDETGMEPEKPQGFDC